MSSQVPFKVGEQVSYPHIFFGPEGKHQLVHDRWLIKAIFPVSGLALISKCSDRHTSIHVGLDKLLMYN